jgi:hypothetical protein
MNLEPITLFIFIFSILVILKNIVIFLMRITDKEPKPARYSNTELIFIGLSISYFITYLMY